MRRPLPTAMLDDAAARAQRKRVHRTVAVLVAIAVVFYMILFVRIIVAKMQ